MIDVLVLANDSVLADIIVSTLSQEIDIDVVRMRYQELRRGDQYSVVILVDEEEAENDPFRVMDLFRDGITLLLIRVSLKSRNIFIYESYQIHNPSIERVVSLVRDFGRANLKKKIEKIRNSNAAANIPSLPPAQIHPNPFAHNA
jgi:hypothetical protein